jgi:Transcriptional regulators
LQSIINDFQPFSSMQKKDVSTVCVSSETKKKIIQAILMESNYLPQNVRARRKAGNKTSPETTGNRRTNGQRAIRVEQETDTREYLAKCQRARYYNKHDIKILNQSLRFSEVFQ